MPVKRLGRAHLWEGLDPEHAAERMNNPAGLRRVGEEERHLRIGQKLLQLRAEDRCFGHKFDEPCERARQREFLFGHRVCLCPRLPAAFARGLEATFAPTRKQAQEIHGRRIQAPPEEQTDGLDGAVCGAACGQRPANPRRDKSNVCRQSQRGQPQCGLGQVREHEHNMNKFCANVKRNVRRSGLVIWACDLGL